MQADTEKENTRCDCERRIRQQLKLIRYHLLRDPRGRNYQHSESTAALKGNIRKHVDKRRTCQISCRSGPRASVNVIQANYADGYEIKPTKHVLQMWNKTQLKPEGTCQMTICNPKNNKKYNKGFIVVKENLTPLHLYFVQAYVCPPLMNNMVYGTMYSDWLIDL